MKYTLFVILLAAILCVAYGSVVKRQVNVCDEAAKESGRCFAYIPSFSYNKDTNSCENFVYGGCGGTGNRFGSEAECESTCKQ